MLNRDKRSRDKRNRDKRKYDTNHTLVEVDETSESSPSSPSISSSSLRPRQKYQKVDSQKNKDAENHVDEPTVPLSMYRLDITQLTDQLKECKEELSRRNQSIAKVRDAASCAVCFELDPNARNWLTCSGGHTLCQTCCRRLLRSTIDRAHLRVSWERKLLVPFRCPVCREVCKVGDRVNGDFQRLLATIVSP